MVPHGKYYVACLSSLILIIFQTGVTSKWTNDGQRFLLEHFDTIHNSPSEIYLSALSLSPSPWLHQCYSPEIKVIKGLPAEWGVCSRTVVLDRFTYTLSYHNNRVAVGSRPGDIIILDTITGTQTAVLSGHTKEVNCVEFSLDGTSLVSGGDDKTVKLWDVQTSGVVKTFSGHTSWVQSVSISADYTTVASGSYNDTICLWDIKTGECHHTIKQEDIVQHVRFSPTDPQHLISVSGEKVWQWDANGCQIKPPFDGQHASFSSDGAQLILCHEKTVTVHNSGSGTTVTEFQTTDSDASWCSFSPDSRLVAVAIDRTAYCWNITSPEPQLVETFIGHTDVVTSLVFASPTILISASRDKSVKFWQIGTQSTDPTVIDPKSIPLHSAPIISLTLQATDGIFITSDSDGMVMTWGISTGIHKASFQTPAKDYKRDVQLINGGLILVYHTDEKIHVWDVGSAHILLVINRPEEYAEDLRISGDGTMFFYLYAPFIWAWSIQTGEAVGQVEIGYGGGAGSLIVDDSKVWAHWPQSEYEGWDFGISGSAPIQLPGRPTLSNGTMLWDQKQGRISNAVTGGIISKRFANPALVQCDGSYLVAIYKSGEMLILNLKDVNGLAEIYICFTC